MRIYVEKNCRLRLECKSHCFERFDTAAEYRSVPVWPRGQALEDVTRGILVSRLYGRIASAVPPASPVHDD